MRWCLIIGLLLLPVLGFACPESCVCSREKKRMKCMGKTTLPLTCPRFVQTLDLKGNVLRSLATDSFSAMSSLTFLLLSSNHIEEISVAAFRGLPRLKQINLRANRLQVLSAGLFKGVSRNIKSIYLHEVKFDWSSYGPIKAHNSNN